MKTIKELEEGCGRILLRDLDGCGNIFLCKECEVQLQTLKDVLKLIDEEIKKEKDCQKNDRYQEQISEHLNQIEMANKIKQKIKGEDEK